MEIYMAKTKKYGSFDNEQNLKRKDSKKNHADSPTGKLLSSTFTSNKKLPDSMVDTDISNVKVKKKLPMAVDIIAGVLMLVIVIGVVVGSYMLFRYYSNDYDSKNVTYDMVIVATDDIEQYKKLVKQDVYFDTTDNSIFFGRVVKVEALDGESGRVLISVSATVKFRRGEGYSIGDRRLAVGSEFAKLRCGERLLGSATVVGLSVNGGK